MKIKSKKNKNTPIIIISLIIALIAGGSAIAYQVVLNKDNLSKSSSPSSKSNEATSNAQDLDSKTDKPTQESNKTKTNTDPQAPTSTDSTTEKTVISVVSSVNVSAGIVYIRGGINNVVDASGTCYVLLKSPSGSTIRKDTTLLPNASTSDCKTIQIKTSELTSGAWTYTLNYSSNTEEGVSSEGTFSIR